MRQTNIFKALFALTLTLLVASCSSLEPKKSNKDNQEQLAINAANNALIANGYEGFKPTGEIHIQNDSQGNAGYEIIFSDGSKTLEVDIVSDGYTPVEIEEDIELKDIPDNIKKAAAQTGENITSCGHYQKATKLDASNEIWFEFEECNNGIIDVEVREKDLQVLTENDDNTRRDDL